MTADDRAPQRRPGSPASPLDRAERVVLAALAEQIDREDPSLAMRLRGPQHAMGGWRGGAGPGRDRRGGAALALFLVVVLGVLAGVVTSGLVWGLAGLGVSAGVLVAVLAVMTLAVACR